MKDLKDLRVEIDAIDQEFVKLFEKRMAIVEQVASYKINNDKPLKDPKREAMLIEKNVALLENKTYEHLLELFFKDLMSYSRMHQSQLMNDRIRSHKLVDQPRVVYQGIEGSFSSIAVKSFFQGDYKTMGQASFEETFEALYDDRADYAVLPIENSSTGAINDVYDLLQQYDLHIIGDVYLKIQHHLIGSGDLKDIEAVYSHEQGFKQSKKFLLDKPWQKFTYSNTAESVKYVKSLNSHKYAAIGSEEAARVYDLKIIKNNIHDQDINTTRFVVLSRKPVIGDQANKISMIIRLSHEPQALFKVLKAIADRKINMLKIESRPIAEKPWAYMFYIDIEGHLDEAKIKDTLKDIKETVHSVQILGNYYSRNGASE